MLFFEVIKKKELNLSSFFYFVVMFLFFNLHAFTSLQQQPVIPKGINFSWLYPIFYRLNLILF
jgi:hypothetical protein